MANKKNKGLCWCLHHNKLLEYCFDFAERVKVIKTEKPADEVPVRLYEMRFVKGKLPAEIVKACEACGKAWEAYDKARNAYDKVCGTCDRARNAYDKVCEAYDKARNAYDKVCETCVGLEKLHKKEVPNTCWNGKELDFAKSKRNCGTEVEKVETENG